MAQAFTPDARIVNKNGARGTVTYVVDVVYHPTITFARDMMEKYPGMSVTYSPLLSGFVSLKTEPGPDGKLQYARDGHGRYLYTYNEDEIAFWRQILSHPRTEIVSHTYSGRFWGTNDDGGRFEYVSNKSPEPILSDEFPRGSVTKELYASKQILQDLFLGQRALALVEAGISVEMEDKTVDGRVIPTYKHYFDALVRQAVEAGDYIGSRFTFKARDTNSAHFVNTKERLRDGAARRKIWGYHVLESNAGEGSENWKAYVDHALDAGGWACFVFHTITPPVEGQGGNQVTRAQAEELFAHTAGKGDDVWVATLTDAMLYFFEWSTATVEVSAGDGVISVSVTDEEPDGIYDMPLTVRVRIPGEWERAACGGRELTVHTEGEERFVYVDAVPDRGPVRIARLS